jgi:hypothetical protein
LYQYAVKLSAGRKAVLPLAMLHACQETLQPQIAVGTDSGVPENNICRLLIINSQHAAMMKSQKLLDSCSVATKVFISYKDFIVLTHSLP